MKKSVLMPLDLQAKQILKSLLDTTMPISAAEVGSSLGLTSRKLRYRLRTLGTWLGESGVQLVAKPGVGYYLIASQSAIDGLKKQITPALQIGGRHSPVERVHALILSLLQTPEPITLLMFQRELSVSRTTVLNDMARVQSWVEERCLELIRRRNSGFLIVGEEANVRDALADCLTESIGKERMLKFFGEPRMLVTKEYLVRVGIRRGVRDLINRLRLLEYHELVGRLEDQTKWYLPDEGHVYLVMRLAIQELRICMGKMLPPVGENLYVIEDGLHHEVVGKLTTFLHKIHGRSLPESESAAIGQLVSSVERKRISSLHSRSSAQSTGDERVSRITSLIIHWSVQLFHPSLKLNHELSEQLAAYIRSMLHAKKVNQPITNPLLAEIMREYPLQFEIMGDIMRSVSKSESYVFSDHDVSFLTMYILAALEELCMPSSTMRVVVVCNAGAATSNLLIARIKREFPGFEIVAQMSYLEYCKNEHLVPHDIVISSIPMPARNRPVIEVSPLLSLDDVTRIRAKLNMRYRFPTATRTQKTANLQATRLTDLLTLHTVRPRVAAALWPDVIDAAGQLLASTGNVEWRYIEAMKQVVLDHGPFMVIMPGVALLHARPEDGVRRLCMSLITLAKPVAFGHEKHDPVSVAIAIGAVDHESHLEALFELNAMLQDEPSLAMIRKTYHRTQILRIVAAFSQ